MKPQQHEYLSEIRSAVRGMTTAEERDYLWAVLETVYRPATSWHRWKLVMPDITIQQMRMLDLLYRRAGFSVSSEALFRAATIHLDPDVVAEKRVSRTLTWIATGLRRLFREYDLPFVLPHADGGYILLQVGPWEPPFEGFDKT